ncbi:hypothetical protein B0H17DRAFT_1085001 [Mycena rosella]|uniref:Uncharacterized protein n=1 Tax=Mycena rosella TaxID=1033263 RepID=A0AAD7G8Z1_MYCRO|nr:hypothetical protein B0H17DRAFT_1085001 [Mycena rosella]
MYARSLLTPIANGAPAASRPSPSHQPSTRTILVIPAAVALHRPSSCPVPQLIDIRIRATAFADDVIDTPTPAPAPRPWPPSCLPYI